MKGHEKERTRTELLLNLKSILARYQDVLEIKINASCTFEQKPLMERMGIPSSVLKNMLKNLKVVKH